MAIRVMLVDDSAVIRGLISRALTQDPEIEIVATAGNGRMAIDSAKAYTPDVVILDIEMPEMDGIAALPKILEVSPNSRVIMASTLTLRNAGISFKALELGAVDYLPKPTSTGDRDALAAFYRELLDKVKTLGKLKNTNAATVTPTPQAAPAAKLQAQLDKRPMNARIQAVAIASSTGGPQALQKLFTGIQSTLMHVPIFVTQHMPPTFTTILAENLTKNGARQCIEANDKLDVVAGQAYIARGDYHMVAEKKAGGGVLIRTNQNAPENFCRPAADPMLRSLSDIYGANLLVVVLTGMGQDGMLGAKYAVERGAHVIAQDEASCVVYGMPKAVADAGICKEILPLDELISYLKKVVL